MQPDGQRLLNLLDRGIRRARFLIAIEGLALGGFLAGALVGLGLPFSASDARSVWLLVGLPLIGGLWLSVAGVVTRARMAAVIERRDQRHDNLLITAEELLNTATTPASGPAPPAWLRTTIYREADQRVDGVDLAAILPARRPLLMVLGGAVTMLVGVLAGRTPTTVALPESGGGGAAAIGMSLRIIVVPPSYLGLKTDTLTDPRRVEAVAGSRLLLTMDLGAPRLVLETLRSIDTLRPIADRRFVADMVASEDGFIALAPLVDSADESAPRHLVGVVVRPDDLPRVRITGPARDLHLGRGDTTLNLTVVADDDHALADLRLRYIRVSGFGERFTFVEGEVPLRLTRPGTTRWEGAAPWPLAELKLEPGDMVVYRAVARDRRPDGGEAESETYLAEVRAPGAEAEGGYEGDPDVERYALSQQMIVIKAERLAAQQGRIPSDSFAGMAALLAAEQRSVRAEFIFMMGGESEATGVDMNTLAEEEHSMEEGEMLGHDLNQGRRALQRATRSMSRVSQHLLDSDAVSALPVARRALVELEDAFSRQRILLRALTQQELLDFTRRLTGTLADARSLTAPVPPSAADPRDRAERQLLARLTGLGATVAAAARQDSLTYLAQQLLALDPGAEAMQQVAALLTDAVDAERRQQVDEALRLVDRAAVRLAERIRQRALPAPVAPQDPLVRQLWGTLRDGVTTPAGGR